MTIAGVSATERSEIRPFHVDIPDESLEDLRQPIAAARLPSKELVEDRSQGVQLATIQELATYWVTGYDLGRVESRLNALPQFTTEIDGVDIHFIHVHSPHEFAIDPTRCQDAFAADLPAEAAVMAATQRPVAELAFDNPDHVEIVIHNYRWRLGLAEGEPQYGELEERLAEAPMITVPTITFEGDANGAPHPDPSSCAGKLSGSYSHRSIAGGVGHNLPPEAPQAFADAVLEVASAK